MKKLLITGLGIFLLACGDIEDCDTDANLDFLIVRFFDLETKASKKVGFQFTVEDSPYRWTFLADTTINSAGDTTIVSDSTFILLPLDPEKESVTYFFDSDTSSHLIQLSYDTELSIFDTDCDPSLTFTEIDTLQYTFDSLSIPGTVTNAQILTNVEVFL